MKSWAGWDVPVVDGKCTRGYNIVCNIGGDSWKPILISSGPIYRDTKNLFITNINYLELYHK